MDERLRELRADLRRTGAAADEAAWLAARLRAGELGLERLLAAAVCGPPGSAPAG